MLVADPEPYPGAESLYGQKDSLPIRRFKATGQNGESLRPGKNRGLLASAKHPKSREYPLKNER